MDNAQPNHLTSLEQPAEISETASAVRQRQRSLRHTIERAIAHRLQTQLAHASYKLELAHPAMQKALAAEQQLLQRGKALRPKRNTSNLQYHWAIALRLYPHLPSATASDTALSLVDFAATLADEIAGVDFSPDSLSQQVLGGNDQYFLAIGSDCFISVEPSGLLQIAVGDRAIILWLQTMLRSPLSPNPLSSNPGSGSREAGGISHTPNLPNGHELNGDQLFWIQAAHARGCSLLRQGSLMHLVSPRLAADLSVAVADMAGCAAWDDAVPLQSPQRAEWELLKTTLTILDDWDSVSAARRWPLLQSMSQSIWHFDAHCRVLADAKHLPPNQAQIRFWALAIACKVLRHSLNSLGLDAPTAL
ncbi:MAG: hypothetical protein AAFY26_14500 [Cyanobacteria bacterium J06638_22]